jgi:hypothetical protein
MRIVKCINDGAYPISLTKGYEYVVEGEDDRYFYIYNDFLNPDSFEKHYFIEITRNLKLKRILCM